MKTEKEFSKYAKPRLEFFWTIESFEGTGNVSTPDWYLVHPTQGHSVWIELKIVKDGRIEFQPGQCQWLANHCNKGGMSYVLLLSEGLQGEPGGVVSLFSGRESRRIGEARVRGREGLANLLSLSLFPPLPLLSGGAWEAIARSLQAGVESREKGLCQAKERRAGGEDLGGGWRD